MRLEATAPGKIVLTGEYAVLDGAPGVAVAVDRRARVSVVASAGPAHSVVAPGFAVVEGRFTADSGRFAWLQDGEAYPLVEAVLRAVGRGIPGCHAFTLDTRSFYAAEDGKKLGIGGSAALAAALAAAVCELTAVPEALFDVALAAHRAFQHGVGSGIDVACSVYGGMLEYRADVGRTATLQWPHDLHFAVYYSGVSASTTARLAKFVDWGRGTSWSRLAEAAERAAVAWRSGASEEILGEARRYVEALQRFSVDNNLSIFDAGHDKLARAADEAGVVYKPCGAGGGDVGIALADELTRLAAFTAGANAAGFRPLELSVDAAGVTLEKHGQDDRPQLEPA